MARKTKRIHDPAAAMVAALERREREREVARLQALGATVTTERTGRVISAYRSNVFNILLSRGTIDQHQYQAAAEMCELWAAWRRLDGKQDGNAEFVDNGRAPPDRRCPITDRMIQAGKELNATLDQLERINCLLIERLVGDTVESDRPRVWRIQVKEAIGEEVRDRQTKAVVSALDDLMRVRRQPRRVAA